MFEKQGLRLFMDGMGPGYAFEINTLVSPLNIFIGDAAAEAIKDAELALEKSTASRGLLAVQHNEPTCTATPTRTSTRCDAFRAGRDGMLPWSYGLEITRLVMAAYMSAEKKRVVDLTDPATQAGAGDLRPADPAGTRGRSSCTARGFRQKSGVRSQESGSGVGVRSRSQESGVRVRVWEEEQESGSGSGKKKTSREGQGQ